MISFRDRFFSLPAEREDPRVIVRSDLLDQHRPVGLRNGVADDHEIKPSIAAVCGCLSKTQC